jgi:hypothetical protein
MEGLGALGFWLAVGMVLAAGAIAGGLKERDKEREKQATLRALLEREGGVTPEVLAYLREKDAAEAARAHAQWVAMGGNMSARTTAAMSVAGIVLGFSFLGGLMAALMANGSTDSWQTPAIILLGAWTGGPLVAFVLYFLIRERKKSPPPGA